MIVIALLVAAIFVAALGLFGAITFKTAALLALACVAAALAVERAETRTGRRVP